MSRDEFVNKYRGQLLLFVTEAWAVRKEKPSDLGLLLDSHMRQLRLIMDSMYDDLAATGRANGIINGQLPAKVVK